ncbi:MAG: SLATT domain-containing protein [Gammaproteobacteria bacterium]|nr:SLATT domain-containing protein [Gammaproteobacteria bacterium]
MNQHNVFERFDEQLWVTIGSRFNASRRLMIKHYASIFTVSILSLYILGINLLPLGGTCPKLAPFISPISILASVFVIILSLLEAGKGYEVKAERLHSNAMDLNALYSRWKINLNQSHAKEMNEIIIEYHEIIKSCPENHEPSDMVLFKSEHPEVFHFSKCKAYKIRFWNLIKIYMLYFILFLLPVGAALLAVLR